MSLPRYPATPTPRCRFCGGILSFFEGRPYCPNCTSFTLPDGTPDPDDYCDDGDSIVSPDDPILLADRLDYQAFAGSREGLLESIRWEIAALREAEEELVRSLGRRDGRPSQARPSEGG